MTPGRSALVLGGSGLVGGHGLRRLLDDPGYARVIAVGRRRLPLAHPKLEQAVVDFERLDAENWPRVDDVFCCLGTTIKAAGSQAAFRRVDYDYALDSARLSVEKGARRLLLVSALGADPASRFFYNRVKGELEAAVARLPFESVAILRPSLLLGEREKPRVGERFAERALKALSFVLIGRLKKYRAIAASQVAAAMVREARQASPGVRILESDRIARPS